MKLLTGVAVLLVLVQCSYQTKILDSNLDLHHICPFHEEITYHVNIASGCRSYYICDSGNFVNFKRCQNATVFNEATFQCDANSTCKTNNFSSLSAPKSPSTTSVFNRITIIKLIDYISKFVNSSLPKLPTFSTKHSGNTTWLSSNKITARKPETNSSDQALPSNSQIKTESDIEKNFKSIEGNYLPSKENASQASLPEALIFDSKNSEIENNKTLIDVILKTIEQTKNFTLNFEQTGQTPPKSPTTLIKKEKSAENIGKTSETSNMSEHLISENITSLPALLNLLPSSNSETKIDKGFFKSSEDNQVLKPTNENQKSNESSNTSIDKKPSLLNQIIIPTVKDIVNNPTLMSKVTIFFKNVFTAIILITANILEQSEGSLPGETINLPKQDFKDAFQQIRTEALPLLKEVITEKIPVLLVRASENVPVILDALDEFESRFKSHREEIKDLTVNLLKKYSTAAKNSSAEYINTYPINEIQKDIEPLLHIVSNVLGKSTN